MKLLVKGGAVLRPFLPQLQTTFVKSLRSQSNHVREAAAEALGIFVGLTPRVDALANDLMKGIMAGDDEEGVLEAIATALDKVMANAEVS